MGLRWIHSVSLPACRPGLRAGGVSLRGAVAVVLACVALGLAAARPAAAQEAAQEAVQETVQETAHAAARGPAGTLLKFVILSRHGVRSPLPQQDELNTWAASTWP